MGAQRAPFETLAAATRANIARIGGCPERRGRATRAPGGIADVRPPPAAPSSGTVALGLAMLSGQRCRGAAKLGRPSGIERREDLPGSARRAAGRPPEPAPGDGGPRPRAAPLAPLRPTQYGFRARRVSGRQGAQSARSGRAARRSPRGPHRPAPAAGWGAVLPGTFDRLRRAPRSPILQQQAEHETPLRARDPASAPAPPPPTPRPSGGRPGVRAARLIS